MNHSTSKRTAKAAPQVESTIYVSGITAKLVKCTARKLLNKRPSMKMKFFLA